MDQRNAHFIVEALQRRGRAARVIENFRGPGMKETEVTHGVFTNATRGEVMEAFRVEGVIDHCRQFVDSPSGPMTYY